jgi:hypothetical protein
MSIDCSVAVAPQANSWLPYSQDMCGQGKLTGQQTKCYLSSKLRSNGALDLRLVKYQLVCQQLATVRRESFLVREQRDVLAAC